MIHFVILSFLFILIPSCRYTTVFHTESYCHICHTVTINDSLNETPCLSPTIFGRLHWPLASLFTYSRTAEMRSRSFQAVPGCSRLFCSRLAQQIVLSLAPRPNMITFYNLYNSIFTCFIIVHSLAALRSTSQHFAALRTFCSLASFAMPWSSCSRVNVPDRSLRNKRIDVSTLTLTISDNH